MMNHLNQISGLTPTYIAKATLLWGLELVGDNRNLA